MRKLLVTLVVLIVLLVAADRVGDVVAERLAADDLQTSQHLAQRPDVSIDGIPFLTQLASGHYQHIEVQASDVRLGSSSLYASSLDVNLYTISVSNGFSTFHVARAGATGTIGYVQLSRALGFQVRYVGGNRIAADKTFHVLGHTIRPTITVTAKLANGVLSFGGATLDKLGGFGSYVAPALRKLFDVSFRFDRVPFDVQVRSISLDTSGLHVALTGSNLDYSRS